MPSPETRVRRRALGAVALALPVSFGAPLAGAWMAGRPAAGHLRFPPRPPLLPLPPEDVRIYALYVVAAVLTLSWLALPWWRSWRRRRHSPATWPGAPHTGGSGRRWPWWGWAGLGLLAAAWVLAWSRFSWFAPWQAHTFTPLWTGLVLLADAAWQARSGAALLGRRPSLLAALAVLSAGFWWYFEYLNTFTGNWIYLGVEATGDREWFWQATLPFATVLPAVVTVTGLLGTLPALADGARGWPALRPGRRSGLALLGAGGLALGLAGAWPWAGTAWIWIGPALVLWGAGLVAGDAGWFRDLERGDWRCLFLPATAAVLCGLLWELWNVHSLAHWVYRVPWVPGPRLFEMPLPGYAGYVPFGVTCALAADLGARVLTGRTLGAWTTRR